MLHRTVLAIVLVAAAPAAALAQQCNPMCQQQLAQRGAPPWDIARVCCQQQFPQPGMQFGAACLSQAGRCGLFQPAPLGSQCFCPTPMGPAPGMVGQ